MTLLEKLSRDVNRMPPVKMTEIYDSRHCPDEFIGMLHIPKPKNCTSQRCIEVCEECWNREYTEPKWEDEIKEQCNEITGKQGGNEMSEAEKRILKERAQAMCEGEQRATLTGMPTHLIYEELGRRLERQGVFIDSIGSIVQKHTEV